MRRFGYRKPIRDPDVLRRMQQTFDLCHAAEEIMRQNLRRRNPSASEAEIEEGLRRWRQDKPLEPDDEAFRVIPREPPAG